MAKRGFFRRITQAAKNVVTSTVETTKSVVTSSVNVVKAPFRRKTSPAATASEPVIPPQPTRPPFTVKSADATERSRRQRILRAKRRQIELRRKREGLMVKRSKGTVDDRVQKYLSMNKRDRNQFHPKDAESRFWDLYDRGVSE